MFSVSAFNPRIPAASVFLYAALILSVFSPSFAEAQEDEDAQHAALMADAEKAFKEGVTPFVQKYCTSCHGPRPKSGLNLDAALKMGEGAWSNNVWKLAVARVKADDMPSDEASDFPTNEEREQFIEWIGKIKYLSPKDPGPFVIRRLSKVEYANTLRDLYGVDPSVADGLPEEVFGEGYLNSLSPMQSELFLGIANKVVGQIFSKEDKASITRQERLFGKTPTEGTDIREAARKVARSLARDAYRRPASEEELDVLAQVFDLGVDNGLEYQQALGLMFKAILVSPQFLFITPAGEVESEEAIVPLDDYQLASRLSYLLWMAPPDSKLAALADQGRLNEPRILRGQVRRMLKDSRSRALFEGFGAQWLGMDKLERQTFDPELFPQMTPEMRSAMMEEARLFFGSIVDKNRSVVEFVDSDYTYLNGTLAELYGLEDSVKGSRMRKVRLTDPNRGGILGMPGTLATTSFPNRTSPVKRGVWVLEQILGELIPPPPPDVPPLEEGDGPNVQGLTLRERTLLHQTDPVCANCHEVLVPIGFGLENFDAIGRWRELDDSGGPIDASGRLLSGETFN
ncbi:MAG: DUF1592 domain-containing protein, partial [Verrucomicrobiae bacterium]|nr:DUF1592 domain-containing protein [Verrucomicrobiae bacterium]